MEIRTYRQLMGHIAQLAYLNKDYLLFFRGQNDDYLNKAGSSTFYPSIYRDDYLESREVFYRFEILDQASRILADAFSDAKIDGYKEVKRKTYIRWSILQHYGVCDTPLLDFTHSVRVACSFAQLDNSNPQSYVYVFALPYITNRISINSEHDLVNVRLLSICPPDALRPYYQDGYLAGTEDVTAEYDRKTELDFKNRLIAKFRIPSGKNFWGRGFSNLPRSVLYPKNDKIERLCNELQIKLRDQLRPGEIGEFLEVWIELEALLKEAAQGYKARLFSVREAIQLLSRRGDLDKELTYELDRLRRFRNQLVHQSKAVEPVAVQENIYRLRNYVQRLQNGLVN